MKELEVSRRAPARAGFTLIELMIVVSILGILAAVALPSLVGYIYRARTIEATSFLAEIRGRQESYRADFDEYCNVSGAQTNWFPAGTPGGSARSWVLTASEIGWTQLGAIPPGRQSIFSYSVVAGLPGPANIGFSGSRGYNGSDFWWIATAVADLDGDGTTLTMESYSQSKSIWSSASAGYE